MPSVSIITPVFNGARFLPGFFSMLQAQSHADFELLLVDDKSTDGTLAAIEPYLADSRFSLIRLPANAGAANARNAGLAQAGGDFVCFLDVDDAWHPDKLRLQHEFMSAQDARLTYTDYARVDANGRLLSMVRTPARIGFQDMLKSNRIGNLTAMVRRDALEGLAFRRTGHEDYVFWLQVMRRLQFAERLASPETLCFYRVHDASLSANKFKAAGWQWNVYRSELGMGPAASLLYMGFYLGHSIHKRL